MIRTKGNKHQLSLLKQLPKIVADGKHKKRAAVAWCDKINTLVPEQRSNAEWHYVLLGEDVFYEWRDKGASIRGMLDYAKLRPVDERVQATFTF
jgi:type III restriction enzyme